MGELSQIPPWAVGLALVLLGMFGRDWLRRAGLTADDNRRQDVAATRLEERLDALYARQNQQADRLQQVESHARDISEVKVAIGRLEERLENLTSILERRPRMGGVS